MLATGGEPVFSRVISLTDQTDPFGPRGDLFIAARYALFGCQDT